MEDRQVSLKQVLDTVDEMPVMKDNNGMEFIEKSLVKTRIGMLQPELNEWCTDCKEYDQERHCCPRWNRVIRQTVEEYKAAQPSFSQPHENDHIADDSKMVAQPEPCDDPRADVYYLAEKIGIHQLYALVVELRGEPEPCEDAVSREAVSKWLKQYGQDVLHGKYKFSLMYIWKNLMDLPSVQPEKRTEERTGTHACDSISRKAAIDALNKEIIKRRLLDDVNDGMLDEFDTEDILRKLPSAQPDQRWIPVTERLPEYMEPVLTWDGSTYCVEKRIPIVRDNDAEEGIPGDWWVSDDYDEYDSDYYPNLRDGACIAWMPLPEPWAEMD